MDGWTPAWKIFEQRDDGGLTTLFHGRRDRFLHGATYKANVRMVSDGGREYLSGFHCFPTIDIALSYKERFTRPRDLVVEPVWVRSTRPKPTNPDVLLAEELMLRRS